MLDSPERTDKIMSNLTKMVELSKGSPSEYLWANKLKEFEHKLYSESIKGR